MSGRITPPDARASGRVLPAGRHGYDAVRIGDWIRTGTAVVTTDAIDAFAALTGDRFAIHMDAAAAQAAGFRGRVAHGLLVLSLIDGLKNQTDAQFDAIASLGWDWSFRKPVYAGDRVSASIEVVDARLTSDAARGILRLRFAVDTQTGEIVQSGVNQLMVHRSPRPASS